MFAVGKWSKTTTQSEVQPANVELQNTPEENPKPTDQSETPKTDA